MRAGASRVLAAACLAWLSYSLVHALRTLELQHALSLLVVIVLAFGQGAVAGRRAGQSAPRRMPAPPPVPAARATWNTNRWVN